jgi:hypothetical protein
MMGSRVRNVVFAENKKIGDAQKDLASKLFSSRTMSIQDLAVEIKCAPERAKSITKSLMLERRISKVSGVMPGSKRNLYAGPIKRVFMSALPGDLHILEDDAPILSRRYAKRRKKVEPSNKCEIHARFFGKKIATR